MRAKLTVSQPSDPDEQEADRVADHVMQAPEAAAVMPDAPASPPAAHAPVASGIPRPETGRPLERGVRDFFEPRFGRSLEDVRVHDDKDAAHSARNLSARAYTYGSQVVFGAGQYTPHQESGRRLLAHELTHVVQRSGTLGRVRRTPEEDAARLAQLPYSAAKSRPLLWRAFATVYTEATGDLPNFPDRIDSECLANTESLGLDADNQGAVTAACGEIAALTDGLEVNGAYQSFDLAEAVKKLYELMPSSDPADIQVTNFGFEYMYGRLVAHSADFVALNLQEYAHGDEIDADAGLSAVAGDSNTAYGQIFQDLSRIVHAMADGKSLLMLELEGLVSTLVELRNHPDANGTRDQQEQNFRKRSEVARRALLVNRKLMQMTDDQTAPTPLDDTVKNTLSQIRRTSASEEDTRKELGDAKSLLAAQPLNMGARVDDPHFAQSGLSEEGDAAKIDPQEAFPKTTDRFMTNTHRSLTDRINTQSEGLKAQLARIVPPHESSKYDLPEFVRVHRHWFSLFGVEKERSLIQQSGALTIYEGIHQATAIGTLSVSGDMMTAWLRYQTMQQAMELLDQHVSTGVDREFGDEINRQKLGRKDKLSGTGASNATYEFGELYDASAKSAEGEAASRTNVGAKGARTSAEKFTAAAKAPAAEQMQAAHQQGLTPKMLPVVGLKSVQAKEGWTYLVEIPDYVSDNKTIAYEQKTATPEVAEFLLAQRQHVATLKTQHGRFETVQLPGRSGKTPIPAHVGLTPALEGGDTSQRSSLDRADFNARKAIGMPGRTSGGPTPSGSALLQEAVLDYLDAFFKRSDSAMRVAAVIHLMNVEHGIGKVFDKMLEPAEIAKVLAKAFGIGFGLGVLGSLGPIGRVLSTGIGQVMKVAGGSDLTAALTVAGFLKLVAGAQSFVTARMLGYIGVPIVEDIKQLFESVISAPAAMAGSKAADATVKAVLDKINQKPPSTIAEAAGLARELANASPEARQEMLAAVDSYIAEMDAQGVGTTHSQQDYDVMVAFRNAFHQQSTYNQVLDPFTTKLETSKPPESAKSPFEGEPFKMLPPGERAKLLGAMGNLAGKVMLFQDPTLSGADAATVRVHYDNGRVRIHHGTEATARDIELHMPTVRKLRQYEGLTGSIRILLGRAIALLGFTQTPEYASKGFEAEQEIAKLTTIRDDLTARQEAIDLNARRYIDQEIDAAVIDRHIADIDKQILEHMRNLDSVEAGRGFIEARKKSAGMIKAEALRLDSATPAGHYWTERDGKLILVQRDPEAEGFFVNQDILAAELAKGKAGDPKLAIRPIAENVSAGALAAKGMGLGRAPAGHHWRQDPAGGLTLVRTDRKAPQFWFDQDGYNKAAADKSDPSKPDPSKFIRPIAEKADSDSASALFEAKSWDDAYKELGGDGTSTSFGKFRKVIGDLGVDKVAIIERMKLTEKATARDETPTGLGIRTIRHTTKQHYIDTVIMPHLTDPVSLADSPRYQMLIEQGTAPRDAEFAASHERLLAITRQLDSADIGSLGEKWNAHWNGQAGDMTQFAVSKTEFATRYPGADLGQDRSLDVLRPVGDDQAHLFEIKNVASPVGAREKAEMDAHLALLTRGVMVPGAAGAAPTPRTIKLVVWVILNPDFLKSNANVVFMTERLKEHTTLEFHVYDANGKVVKITHANYQAELKGLVIAAQKATAP